MEPKIKLITGYSDDEKYTVGLEEAHKAYYLFRNPELRAVFKNGLAILGKDIKRIVPDFHSVLGYPVTHKLDSEDWNYIKSRGIEEKYQKALAKADIVSLHIDRNPKLLTEPLNEIIKMAQFVEKMEAIENNPQKLLIDSAVDSIAKKR